MDMKEIELAFTSACQQLAKEKKTPWKRRIRIVRTNKAECAYSDSDIWCSIKGRHHRNMVTGEMMKPPIYVNRRLLNNPDMDIDRLLYRIIAVAHEADFEPTLATAMSRNA